MRVIAASTCTSSLSRVRVCLNAAILLLSTECCPSKSHFRDVEESHSERDRQNVERFVVLALVSCERDAHCRLDDLASESEIGVVDEDLAVCCCCACYKCMIPFSNIVIKDDEFPSLST